MFREHLIADPDSSSLPIYRRYAFYLDDLCPADEYREGIRAINERHVDALIAQYGPRSGRWIEDLFRELYGHALTPSERRFAITDLLERRMRWQDSFFEQIGLSRQSDLDHDFNPGTWKLTPSPGNGCVIYTVSAITTPLGRSVGVNLTSKQFYRAGSVWRAIVKAISPEDTAKPLSI